MCWCTPNNRTPICDNCPPDKKKGWPKEHFKSKSKSIKEKLLGLFDEKGITMTIEEMDEWLEERRHNEQ